ncbi:MAG: histidine kinase, partial [Verrucomicrobiota bacterium]
PDTTGCWVIDDLSLTRSSNPEANLWANGGFDKGERTDQIGGIPEGWVRGGSEPAIARVMQGASPELGLLDAEQDLSGYWTCTQNLSVRPGPGGETFRLAWMEAFNVISGSLLRSTFLNVPPGKYTFRAIAVADNPLGGTSQLAFPIVIRQPFWQQAWFLPLLAAAAVMFIGWALFRNYRRRARARIATIRQANAIERDRARIARDMHDDLGTRVSLIKHTASVVRQAIEHDSAQASRQVQRLESAASDLVLAMDGLVWAVNPANDTLEHLASHLSGMAQEIFRDAPVTLRLAIPMDLPALLLRSDFRHHFSLIVKEALHNILKHAGPCEATLELTVEGDSLVAIVADTGTGFDPAHPKAGNGLHNLSARTAEIHGTCEIQSLFGHGTSVTFRCPLHSNPLP